MMGKRAVSLSFIVWSTGFSLMLYTLFILACDIGPLRIGVFRTFGTNPLAAYVIHYMWYTQIHTLTPEDSPLWFAMSATAGFFILTYLTVRHLEKHNVYIRL